MDRNMNSVIQILAGIIATFLTIFYVLPHNNCALIFETKPEPVFHVKDCFTPVPRLPIVKVLP